MSDDLTPNLALPFLLPAQAQKHVTVNEALTRLDALVQLAVMRRDLSAPPSAPAEGERQIVGPAPSGEWAGQAGRIALFAGGGWQFLTPRAGWRAWVVAEGRALVHDGAGWTDGPQMLGVNTAPDAVNRLAVASEAVLFTHAGGDQRLVLNKAGATDTASLVFQSGWQGLAEMGLAGGEDFTIKAHDGAQWFEALRIDRTSHALLAGGGALYHQGNLLGEVTQAGGAVTGAVMERGTGPSGDWLRLADGTQLCHHVMAGSAAAATTWTYPKPFASAPVVTGTVVAGVLSVLCLDAPPDGDAASFSLRDGAGARRGDDVHLLAAGRWA
ncbi:MAG: DUF2793 domain-containing protein [Rubellimicrobium sp.]|nr:DUF2793 domain-containing protein [Rubellimicrobium sp.]